MTPADQTAVLGIGIVALFSVGAALFKTSTLRGDANQRWAPRVDLAISGLEEKMLAELEALRDEINDLLPVGEAFDPNQALTDPGSMVGRATRVAEMHVVRNRMQNDLKRLRSVATALVPALLVLAIAVVALAAYHGDLLHYSGVRVAGVGCCGVAGVALITLWVAYFLLQQRLANGEELAGTAGKQGP